MTQIGFGSFSANDRASATVMSAVRRKHVGVRIISCLREPSGLKHKSHAPADLFNLKNVVEVLLGQPLATGL